MVFTPHVMPPLKKILSHSLLESTIYDYGDIYRSCLSIMTSLLLFYQSQFFNTEELTDTSLLHLVKEFLKMQ